MVNQRRQRVVDKEGRSQFELWHPLVVWRQHRVEQVGDQGTPPLITLTANVNYLQTQHYRYD